MKASVTEEVWPGWSGERREGYGWPGDVQATEDQPRDNRGHLREVNSNDLIHQESRNVPCQGLMTHCTRQSDMGSEVKHYLMTSGTWGGVTAVSLPGAPCPLRLVTPKAGALAAEACPLHPPVI